MIEVYEVGIIAICLLIYHSFKRYNERKIWEAYYQRKDLTDIKPPINDSED